MVMSHTRGERSEAAEPEEPEARPSRPDGVPGRRTRTMQLGLRARGRRTLTEIAYPHASRLHSALGMSIPGSAVHDPLACEARGVPAFTDGSVTAFASPAPVLHIAAHEAAHQLQHAGLTRDGGLGAELHAHAVAEAITAGGSAAHLIGGRGDAVAPAIHDYTEISAADQVARNQWRIGSDARVAEAGKMVTSVTDRHVCFADPQLIEDANLILRAKQSGVQLRAGTPGPSGDAPDGSGHRTTVQVVASVGSQTGGGDNYADCGRMSREVQGTGGNDTPSRGVYRDGAGVERETPTATREPETIRDEVLVGAGLGATPAAARAAYLAMTPAQRDAFDQQHRINRYAAPGVGESYTSRRDDASTGAGFNFHWGGVIMVAEPDRVTLENFARPGTSYGTQNALWYFDMYGPPSRPGQTWHDRWAEGSGREGLGVGAPGHDSMTMTARTSADPSPWTRAAHAMTTADLVRRYAAASEPGERMALDAEMRTRWIRVTVNVVRAQENPDQVYVTAEHGGRRFQTARIDLRTGDRNTFWVPMSALAPVSGRIVVGAYDWDALSADDHISAIWFQDPFTPTTSTAPFDGAEYHTTVEFDR
jgi:hypothetical protein